MKNKISEIDDLIKASLTEEEAKFYDELDEQNAFEMLGGLFSGKNKWLIIIMNIFTLVGFALLIYCITQFFNTEITNELIKWGGGAMVCLIVISMMKLFAWMQMNKNAIMREMKRLELQLSSIVESSTK